MLFQLLKGGKNIKYIVFNSTFIVPDMNTGYHLPHLFIIIWIKNYSFIAYFLIYFLTNYSIEKIYYYSSAAEKKTTEELPVVSIRQLFKYMKIQNTKEPLIYNEVEIKYFIIIIIIFIFIIFDYWVLEIQMNKHRFQQSKS